MQPLQGKFQLPADLPAQFEGSPSAAQGGLTLVLDGDALAYKCAATVKTLPTAIRRFQQGVLELMFLARCSDARIHLTSADCVKLHRGLYPTVKPYQGNRSGKAKPALLEPLREAMLQPENWLQEFEGVYLHRFQEADDAFCADMWSMQGAAVLASEDKDSRIVPWPRYDYETTAVHSLSPGDFYGYIERTTTPSGKVKIVGHGWKFLLFQLLAGDKADNVAGLTRLNGRLCGDVTGFEYLEGIQTFPEALEAVLQAYIENQQDILAELEMVWLRRNALDSGYAWLTEQIAACGLAEEYLSWVHLLRQRSVQYIEEAYGIDIAEITKV